MLTGRDSTSTDSRVTRRAGRSGDHVQERDANVGELLRPLDELDRSQMTFFTFVSESESAPKDLKGTQNARLNLADDSEYIRQKFRTALSVHFQTTSQEAQSVSGRFCSIRRPVHDEMRSTSLVTERTATSWSFRGRGSSWDAMENSEPNPIDQMIWQQIQAKSRSCR